MRKKFRAKIVFVIATFITTIICQSQAIDPSSLQKGAYTNLSYTTSDGKILNYQIYVPSTFQPSSHLPLIVWMHGGGPSAPGGQNPAYDILTLLKTNPNWNENTYPCVLLEPLCSPVWCGLPSYVSGRPCWDGFGYAYGCPAHVHNLSNPPVGIKYVCELVQVLEKDLGLDPLRCYTSGWSNGGYAAWDLIMLRPDLFAAAVPISGAADTSHASRFANIPVWAFHSSDDSVVPFSGSQTIVNKLISLGGTPKITDTKGWNHAAYAPAWYTPELVPWLFSQGKAATPVQKNEDKNRISFQSNALTIRVRPSGSLQMIRHIAVCSFPSAGKVAMYDLHGKMMRQNYR